MPTFAGVNHLSLSVTDLERSQRFYTEVLDFIAVMDFGYARSLFHQQTGFLLALTKHDAAAPAPFSELATGLDHVGLAAADRDELVAWERRFDALGVEYTPIRDMEFGHHLNFRDPDSIALEFQAPNVMMAGWLAELSQRDIPPEEIRARVAAHLASLQGEG
jgi:glyoxylase I family protein